MNCHEFARISNNGDPTHLSPDARAHLSSCAAVRTRRDRASSAAAAAGSRVAPPRGPQVRSERLVGRGRRPSTVRSDEIGVAAAQRPGRIHRRRLRGGRRASRVQTRAGRPQGRALRGRRRRLSVQWQAFRRLPRWSRKTPRYNGITGSGTTADTTQQRRDTKYVPDKDPDNTGGVWYPRVGAVGGCTIHSALISMYPSDSDWDEHRPADRRFELELGPHAARTSSASRTAPTCPGRRTIPLATASSAGCRPAVADSSMFANDTVMVALHPGRARGDLPARRPGDREVAGLRPRPARSQRRAPAEEP